MQRCAQLLTAIVILPVLIRTLGFRDFGVWGAATSLAWLSSLLDLGIGGSLISLLPQAIVAGDKARARQFVAAALFGGCGLALVVLVVGGAAVLSAISGSEASTMLIAVVGLAVNVPLSMSANIWFGLQRGHVAAGWEFVQTGLTFTSLLLMAALHESLAATVAAVYVPMVLVNAMSLAHLFFLYPHLRPRWMSVGAKTMRLVLGKGGILFATTVAFSSCYVFDNILALHWLGPAASGQAAIALRICTTAAGMLAVLTQPLWPSFVEAVSVGDRSWAMHALLRGTATVAILSICGAFLIGIWGGFALRAWLGPDVDFPQDLLWVTGAWVVVLCMPRVATLYFNAASVLKFQLWVAVGGLVATFTLKYWLAHRFGVPGLIAAAPIGWLLVAWPSYLWLTTRLTSGRYTLLNDFR